MDIIFHRNIATAFYISISHCGTKHEGEMNVTLKIEREF